MVVDTIHLSAVAMALLRFGPFARILWANVFVLCDGKGSSEWLKKIKRSSK